MAGRHLEGKVAVVTGGAGGMGSWICKIFAQQGAKVIVADTGADVEGRMGLDPTRVNAVVDEIKKNGGEAMAMIGDISEMDVAENLIKAAIDNYGGLDILVCAHGILRERMIFNMEEDDWDAVMKSHLKGVFAPTKFAAIYWRQERERGGRIIYFTSGAGINGEAGQPNYSAAHAGKIGLSLSNAQALARYNVTSNCIAPGAATRMTDRGRAVNRDAPPPSESAAGTARDPMNAVPSIVYLASDEGKDITGRVIGVGGHRITMYREPSWNRSVYAEEPLWTTDALFKVMAENFRKEDFEPPGGWRREPAPAAAEGR
jgi:NAD(P)-dependent dehydrogenase (short-subunit alcohol dehydrogenase family)